MIDTSAKTEIEIGNILFPRSSRDFQRMPGLNKQ